MKTKLLIVASIIVLIITTCKNPAEPEPEPGRRDYIWAIDTINVYGGINSGVYASDPNNIWVAFDASDNQKLLHYNGIRWETVNIKGNYQPNRITGNAANDIWILPTYGDTYRFDGNGWYSVRINNNTKYERIIFSQVAWDDNGEVYAAGYGCRKDYSDQKGVIARFRNNEWEIIKQPEIDGAFVQIAYDSRSGKYYLLCWPEGMEKIYCYDGKTTECFDEGYGLSVHQIGKKTFLQKEGFIYHLKNNKPEKFFDEKIRERGTPVFGNSDKDMFFIKDQTFSHYNGKSIKGLFEISDKEIIRAAKTGIDVSVLITYNRYNSENYIYIGKLDQQN